MSAAMLAGGGLAAAGIVLLLAETGIALSVLTPGLLIATRRLWAAARFRVQGQASPQPAWY